MTSHIANKCCSCKRMNYTSISIKQEYPHLQRDKTGQKGNIISDPKTIQMFKRLTPIVLAFGVRIIIRTYFFNSISTCLQEKNTIVIMTANGLPQSDRRSIKSSLGDLTTLPLSLSAVSQSISHPNPEFSESNTTL